MCNKTKDKNKRPLKGKIAVMISKISAVKIIEATLLGHPQSQEVMTTLFTLKSKSHVSHVFAVEMKSISVILPGYSG